MTSVLGAAAGLRKHLMRGNVSQFEMTRTMFCRVRIFEINNSKNLMSNQTGGFLLEGSCKVKLVRLLGKYWGLRSRCRRSSVRAQACRVRLWRLSKPRNLSPDRSNLSRAATEMVREVTLVDSCRTRMRLIELWAFVATVSRRSLIWEACYRKIWYSKGSLPRTSSSDLVVLLQIGMPVTMACRRLSSDCRDGLSLSMRRLSLVAINMVFGASVSNSASQRTVSNLAGSRDSRNRWMAL